MTKKNYIVIADAIANGWRSHYLGGLKPLENAEPPHEVQRVAVTLAHTFIGENPAFCFKRWYTACNMQTEAERTTCACRQCKQKEQRAEPVT